MNLCDDRFRQQPILIDGKTPWVFACGWYTPDEVERCIANEGKPGFAKLNPVPRDVESREVAEWMADQYRLAMRKGIELGINATKDAAAAIFEGPGEAEVSPWGWAFVIERTIRPEQREWLGVDCKWVRHRVCYHTKAEAEAVLAKASQQNERTER